MNLFIDILALIGFAIIFYLVLSYVRIKKPKKDKKHSHIKSELYEFEYDIDPDTVDRLQAELELIHRCHVDKEIVIRMLEFKNEFNRSLPDFTYMSDEIEEGYTFEKMKGFINKESTRN